MNIGIVSNVVYPFIKGGAEKRIHEISTRLVERGHEVTIYCRQWWDGPAEIDHEGISLHAVSGESELYVGDRRSITEAIKFGKDVVNPLRKHGGSHDLIVVSVFPYFPVIGTALGNIFNDTPVATTWLEVWDNYWYEYLGSLGIFGKLIERVSTYIPQYPIGISTTVARDLEKIGFDSSEIHIVPGGIDIERIKKVQAAENGFDVLFAGRLIEHKNVDILIESFDNLAKDFDITLGIIGDGPQHDELVEYASSLESSDRITFLGFLDEYDAVLSHMHAADLFVSPSTREGFGITLAEAMAADCVVVTVDHPDSAGSKVVGEGGFVTSPTREAIEEAMHRYLQGERPNNDPVSSASRYDWDEVARRAERTYQDIIRKHQEKE